MPSRSSHLTDDSSDSNARCWKPSHFWRRAILRLGVIAVIIGASYFIAEQSMFARIRRHLDRIYGNEYAILRINIGGIPVDAPSLLAMLRLAYVYRFSDDYRPQGTGGFTGKKNYLVIMISDNDSVCSYNWSFLRFQLEEHVPPARIIDMPEGDTNHYIYNPEGRVRRRGLLLSGNNFNNPKACFYGYP